MAAISSLDRVLILEWRSDERVRVMRVLEDGIPELRRDVADQIDALSLRDMLRLKNTHDAKIAPIVERWLTQQAETLQSSIERSADASEAVLGEGNAAHDWRWNEVAGIAAGTVLSVAPVAVAPAAVSLATVTTTSLFLFTSSVVSIPILTAIVAGSVAAGIGGQRMRSWTIDKLKTRYRNQVAQEIDHKVLGDPEDEASASLLRFFLREIDLAAERRLEEGH